MSFLSFRAASSTAFFGQDGDAEDNKNDFGTAYNYFEEKYGSVEANMLLRLMDANEAKLEAKFEAREAKLEAKFAKTFDAVDRITARLSADARFSRPLSQWTYGYCIPLARYSALEAMCYRYAEAVGNKNINGNFTLNAEDAATEYIEAWINADSYIKSNKMEKKIEFATADDKKRTENDQQFAEVREWKEAVFLSVGSAIHDYVALYMEAEGRSKMDPGFLLTWKEERDEAAHELGQLNPELVEKIVQGAQNGFEKDEIRAYFSSNDFTKIEEGLARLDEELSDD